VWCKRFVTLNSSPLHSYPILPPFLPVPPHPSPHTTTSLIPSLPLTQPLLIPSLSHNHFSHPSPFQPLLSSPSLASSLPISAFSPSPYTHFLWSLSLLSLSPSPPYPSHLPTPPPLPSPYIFTPRAPSPSPSSHPSPVPPPTHSPLFLPLLVVTPAVEPSTLSEDVPSPISFLSSELLSLPGDAQTRMSTVHRPSTTKSLCVCVCVCLCAGERGGGGAYACRGGCAYVHVRERYAHTTTVDVTSTTQLQ